MCPAPDPPRSTIDEVLAATLSHAPQLAALTLFDWFNMIFIHASSVHRKQTPYLTRPSRSSCLPTPGLPHILAVLMRRRERVVLVLQHQLERLLQTLFPHQLVKIPMQGERHLPPLDLVAPLAAQRCSPHVELVAQQLRCVSGVQKTAHGTQRHRGAERTSNKNRMLGAIEDRFSNVF